MSTQLEINQQIQSHLNSMVGLPPVAWPNVDLEPQLNQTYLRPTVIHGIPVKLGVSDDDRFITRSILQIDVFTPKGKGAKDALDLVDKLMNHFYVGFEMFTSTNLYKIRISSRSSESGMVVGTFYVIPVLINFQTVTD